MTNEMIILENSIRLAKEGVLKYTGREYKFADSEGKEHVIKEVEPIHTYNGWKELGFQMSRSGMFPDIAFAEFFQDGIDLFTVRCTGGAERGEQFFPDLECLVGHICGVPIVGSAAL